MISALPSNVFKAMLVSIKDMLVSIIMSPSSRIPPETKTSFEEAAYGARCSGSDLVRLMTSSYSNDLLGPVLDDLRQGNKLTSESVFKICKLLKSPWLPPPPPPSRPPPITPGIFRDSGGGVTMIVRIGDDLVSTTHISKDRVATTNLISVPPGDDYFTKDASDLLTMFPVHHGRLIGKGELSLKILQRPEFLPFLKLQLVDMIHGFYLRAIAMLPVHALREGHLIHAVLTAGHCYGRFQDPRYNIIFNSIWYSAVFPLSKDVTDKVGAADILDARSMHRVESRSLDGLVDMVCSSLSMDEQDAVLLLLKHRLDLHNLPVIAPFNMCDVALAAKHPQPAALGAFWECVDTHRLLGVYRFSRSNGNPDAAFEQLKMSILQETMRIAAPLQLCALDLNKSGALEWLNSTLCKNTAWETLSAKRSSFILQQAQVRTVLEELLLGYGHSDPLEPIYKLGVICGVARERYYSCTDCYHVNFLASSDGGSSCKLFFAEFWNQADPRIEESTKSFCCIIPDYHEYPGRCVVCENNSSTIVHPQSGQYHMGNTTLSFPAPSLFEADTSGKLDFDLIYLDL